MLRSSVLHVIDLRKVKIPTRGNHEFGIRALLAYFRRRTAGTWAFPYSGACLGAQGTRIPEGCAVFLLVHHRVRSTCLRKHTRIPGMWYARATNGDDVYPRILFQNPSSAFPSWPALQDNKFTGLLKPTALLA